MTRVPPSSLAVSSAQQTDSDYTLSKSKQGDENQSSGNIQVDRVQIVSLISAIGQLWLQKKNEIQISEQIPIILNRLQLSSVSLSQQDTFNLLFGASSSVTH